MLGFSPLAKLPVADAPEQNVSQLVTGFALATSVGTPSQIGRANVPVTGQSATAQVGDEFVNVGALGMPTGQQVSVSVGTVSLITHNHIPVLGNQLLMGRGSQVNDVTVVLQLFVYPTGSQATFATPGNPTFRLWDQPPEGNQSWTPIPNPSSSVWTEI